MISIKKFTVILLVLAMVLSLAACGGSGDTGTSTAESTTSQVSAGESTAAATESAEPSVTPGKKGTIEFWTVFTGADGKSMQAIVNAYNATSPDYTVNHRAIEANDLYLKMPLAVQSGQDVPDVCINHVERLRLFKDNGFLTDLTPLLANSGIKAENYNPKGWSMSDLDGGHFGVPLDVHSFGLYVNMDLYAKYGNGALDDSVLTWDEINASAEKAKADGIIPLGMTWLRVKFLASYAQLGGKLSTDGKTPDFNNDTAKKVLQNWLDEVKAGNTNKDGDTPWEMFLGGKVLYCPEGQWMYNNVKESGMNAKFFDYPVFDAKVKGNWSSSHQFVIPKDDKRPADETKAALDFVNYVGNNGLEWAKAGQTPAHISIKSIAEFKDMPQAFLANENEELKIYDYKYYGYAVESLDKVLPEILWGRMSIEDGLAQAVQETKDRIATEG